jgi:mono/diheme cytochrome c family protein
MSRYFQSENRYRDTAIHPDGKTIYVATDDRGMAENVSGGFTTKMADRGSILAFTFEGEGDGKAMEPVTVSEAPKQEPVTKRREGPSAPPRFTAKQVADGKKSYESYCAVCHGSTLTNGTFGTPLAGPYFKDKWVGQSVHAFYEKSLTMPPGKEKSLPGKAYVDAVAYILEFNGAKPGPEALPAGGETLKGMWIE